ncbi:unnamed protein product [Spodoptera littoralis]|uniref:Uncharacterized protein n=1 Tax=Spodoptera littoralis TaxID=7109 RepID=A0A9P0N1Z0_SPOLI|nr:unnamed protein product [Spodoptera littoralis]CAH1638646.1 unnamed protein product [Spodoptera littoralis]
MTSTLIGICNDINIQHG